MSAVGPAETALATMAEELPTSLFRVVESAVDPLEIAASLETCGLSNAVVRDRLGWKDVFSLAEQLYTEVQLRAAPAADLRPTRTGNLSDLGRGLVFAAPTLMFAGADVALRSWISWWMLPLSLACGWAFSQVVAYMGFARKDRPEPTGSPLLWAVLAALAVCVTLGLAGDAVFGGKILRRPICRRRVRLHGGLSRAGRAPRGTPDRVHVAPGGHRVRVIHHPGTARLTDHRGPGPGRRQRRGDRSRGPAPPSRPVVGPSSPGQGGRADHWPIFRSRYFLGTAGLNLYRARTGARRGTWLAGCFGLPISPLARSYGMAIALSKGRCPQSAGYFSHARRFRQGVAGKAGARATVSYFAVLAALTALAQGLAYTHGINTDWALLVAGTALAVAFFLALVIGACGRIDVVLRAWLPALLIYGAWGAAERIAQPRWPLYDAWLAFCVAAVISLVAMAGAAVRVVANPVCHG